MRNTILVGGLVATAALVAGCGLGGSTPTPAPPPAPTAAPPTPPTVGAHAGGARQGIRGTVAAEDGSPWTVTTAAGKRFTITVTPQTAFGTRKAPASAQQFPVGTLVRVAGPVTGTAVTAERITTPPPPAAGTSPAPAPATLTRLATRAGRTARHRSCGRSRRRAADRTRVRSWRTRSPTDACCCCGTARRSGRRPASTPAAPTSR